MPPVIKFTQPVDFDGNVADDLPAASTASSPVRKQEYDALVATLATDAEVAALFAALGTAAYATVGTGSGQLPTKSQIDTLISTAVNALVAGAPGLLDTLDEIASALADDPNFAATMTTALAGKASTVHSHDAADIVSGIVAVSRLGSGTPSAANWLRGDGAWTAIGQGDVTGLTVALAALLPLAGGVLTGATIPAPVVLTDAATIAVNAALGNQFEVVLGGNRTLGNPTGLIDGQWLTVFVKQPSAGGPRTLAYDTNYAFSTDLPVPTLSTAADAVDVLQFRYRGGSGKLLFVGAIKGFGNV